jgi:hemolysin activation/secretion protein
MIRIRDTLFAGLLSAPVMALLITLTATQILAQETEFLERGPGEPRPPLPSYQTPPAGTLGLPPGAPPLQGPLSSQIRVFVRRFKLTGNTVFSAEELAAVTAPYENRVITSEELQELRHQLTLYYVDHGYINSGAVIPDQKITDGVIQIDIVEGKLTAVDITGNDWLRSDYLKDRLAPDLETPLNIQELQQRLQLLQQNPLLEQLNAELVPGVKPGEGILRLAVKEAKPYEVGVIFANDRPPDVGAEEAKIYGLIRDLTGWGDSLGLSYDYSLNGYDTNGWQAFYSRPLNAYDTTLKLWYETYYSTLLEDSFNRNRLAPYYMYLPWRGCQREVVWLSYRTREIVIMFVS